MLVLVSVLLLSLIVSTIVIFMYRLVLSLHHHVQRQVDKPRSVSWMELATQQGFGSFLKAPEEHVRVAKLKRFRNGIKAPWGW